MKHLSLRGVAGLLLPATLLALVVVGCGKKEEGAAATGAVDTAAGKAVYDANGCANCHGGGNAPKLDHIGGEHDAAWIVAHVKDPKTHNPGSRMPGYAGKIADADLEKLGAYLAAQK